VSALWPRWALYVCAAALLLSALILFWPSTQHAMTERGSEPERWTGPLHQMVRTSQVRQSALRLPGSEIPVQPDIPAARSQAPTLVGVAISGRARLAYLRTSGGEVERIGVGQTLDGWRVVSISERTVTLESNGNRLPLRLYAAEE
jgi:hypothetical protein